MVAKGGHVYVWMRGCGGCNVWMYVRLLVLKHHLDGIDLSYSTYINTLLSLSGT